MIGKNKKILYIITKSNFGGAQKYVFELAEETVKKTTSIKVIAGGNGTLIKKLKEIGIEFIPVPYLSRDINFISDFKSLRQLLRIFNEEKPDIIHLNSSKVGFIGSIAGIIYNLKHLKNKAKIIFTIHGWAFNERRNWFSKLFFKFIYYLIISTSHKTIAVSNATAKQLKDIPFGFLLKKKVIIIKNEIRKVKFIDGSLARNFIRKEIEKSNPRQKIRPNTTIIGSLAELHEIKGISYLIAAAERLIKKEIVQDVVFVIFGTGEIKTKLQNEITKRGLEKNFFLLGFIPEASIYLKGFDLYICSSLSEGLSLVLLETKQARIPIIATNVGGNSEILEKYPKRILIQEKSSRAIYDSIRFMLSQKFKETKVEKNDFQEMIEATQKIYGLD